MALVLTAPSSNQPSSLVTQQAALCTNAIAQMTRPLFLARSAKVGKLWRQDKDWRVAKLMYLYAATSLTVQPRKSDKNVVGSGHVREYRSTSVVANVITLISVANFRNVTRSHKVRYARSTCTVMVRELYIGRYCMLWIVIPHHLTRPVLWLAAGTRACLGSLP